MPEFLENLHDFMGLKGVDLILLPPKVGFGQDWTDRTIVQAI